MSVFSLFKASVDFNSHLSNSEKLNFSKDCVNGEAAILFGSITVTDARSYNIALKLFKDQNKSKGASFKLVCKQIGRGRV